MAFEASVANNQRYEDVNVTFPIEVSDPNVRQDVHSVSSLLKLYFRELPGLFVIFLIYQNYDNSFSGFFIQFLAIFQTQCAPTNCTKNFWRLPELRKIWDWVQWDK